MRSMVRLIGLMVMLAILPACADLFGPGYRYAQVTVEVLDPAGAPIPAVGLTLYTGARHMGYGATDQNGRHVFEFVPAGAYGVAASVPQQWQLPPGGSNIRLINVADGEALEVGFVLAPRALE